jgi:hypothetical protein
LSLCWGTIMCWGCCSFPPNSWIQSKACIGRWWCKNKHDFCFDEDKS